MKFAFLSSSSMCYGTLQFFTQQIIQTCENVGIEVVSVDLITTDFFSQGWDAILGINQTSFAEQMEDGSFLFDYCNCPIISIIVDAPYYHHMQLKAHPKNLHLICLDENHVAFAQKYYGPLASVHMGFLSGPIAKHPLPYKERSISLLFSGTRQNCEKYRQQLIDSPNPYVMPLFDFIINDNIEEPDRTTEESIWRFCSANHLSLEQEAFKEFITQVGVIAEFYLRNYYREKILCLLIDAGIDVTLVGNGWDALYPQVPSNLHLLGSLGFDACTELSGQAKIFLNVMPLFKAGMHDRILTGIQNGALVLTDSSSYIDSHFTDGENIVLYDLHHLELLPELVKNILVDDESAVKIIENGKKFIRSPYSWENFVLNCILPCLS